MQPDNLYGDEAPVDILWHYDDIDVNRTPLDQSPDQGEGPSIPRVSLSLTPVNGITANISQEGGAKLIYYLLSAAIQPLDEAGGNFPNVSNVHEWHYKDLMLLPEAAWKE